MRARLRLTLVAGFSGLLMVFFGLVTRGAVERLFEVPSPSWGMSELTDAVVAGVCALGFLGSLWHLASAALALIVLPVAHDQSSAGHLDGSGLASRILAGWGAPAVRRIAASALVLSLSSAPALAAEGSGSRDDLGWRPTSSAPAPPSASPTPEAQADPSRSEAEPDAAQHASESPMPSPGAPGESADSPPPTRPGSGAATAPEAEAASDRTHTVRPGESLWSITAHLLPAGADPAQVARAWPTLYRANAEVIGPNPSLIRPGVVLSVPSSLTASTTGGQSPSP